MKEIQLVIIGGGPAGMAAAIAAYDKGIRDIAILEREAKLGGILRQCIHSGFGLHKLGRELTGPEYAAVYAEMTAERKIPVYTETTVTSLTEDRIITATNRNGILKIKAGAVILAMGCRERSRGAIRIPGTRPAGIYTAGTAQKLINCDGYRVGKKAVILGSGDIGLIMARRLTLEGIKVEAVAEIMPYSGGLTRNIVQCLDDFGIPLLLSTTVAEIHGRERLEGVTLAEVDENKQIKPESKRFVACDTLLLSVGLIPENELSRKAGIPIDRLTSGALVNERRETAIPGIFACGNVLQVHDLVDYVSDESELAGRGAADFLMRKSEAAAISVLPGKGVRYVLPQRISGKGETALYLRVEQPLGKTKLRASAGGEILAETVHPRATPGEMLKIAIPPADIAICGEITVEAEEIE